MHLGRRPCALDGRGARACTARGEGRAIVGSSWWVLPLCCWHRSSAAGKLLQLREHHGALALIWCHQRVGSGQKPQAWASGEQVWFGAGLRARAAVLLWVLFKNVSSGAGFSRTSCGRTSHLAGWPIMGSDVDDFETGPALVSEM